MREFLLVAVPVFCLVWMALSLCVARAKPVPPIRARVQEDDARRSLYGGRRQDVSSVCASKPKYGECPLGIWDDER